MIASPKAQVTSRVSTQGDSQSQVGSSDAVLGPLRAAAEAIVESLVSGSPWDDRARALRDLRDAFLAESADSSEAAAQRCESIRRGFATIFSNALARREHAASVLDGGPAPRVRVEVRGTAGREMLFPAFAVGRASECDVQAYGDLTVSRLQLVVISLPKAIIVIDNWSASGTHTLSREASSATVMPQSMGRNRVAFVLAHGERVTLRLGAQTTLTFGPSASAIARRNPDAPLAVPPTLLAPPKVATPKREKRIDQELAMRETLPSTLVVASPLAAVAVPLATPPNTAVDPVLGAGPPSRAPYTDGLHGGSRQHSTPRQSGSAQPDVVRDSLPPTLVTPTQAAALPASCADPILDGCPVASAGDVVPAAHGGSPPDSAPRLRHGATLRSKLQWRIYTAANANLISESQKKGLLVRIQPGHEGFDEVSDIMDGLGVGPAPSRPLSLGSDAPVFPGTVVRIVHLVESTDLNGVRVICQEWLEDRRRWSVQLPNGQRKALRPENLSTDLGAEEAFAVEMTGEPTIFRCRKAGCDKVCTLSRREPRQRFDCSCGTSSCTGCGDSYHHHAKCEEVPGLRTRWTDWVDGRGRSAYRRLRCKAVNEAATQMRALREAASQPELDLSAEPRASARAPARALARKRRLLAARAKFIKGEGVRHLFTQCAICKSRGQCIVGPRFRCIHCPTYDVCLKCERRLSRVHDTTHVFQVMFECAFDWAQTGVQLPAGTRARLRQHPLDKESGPAGLVDVALTSAPTRRKRKAAGYGLEGVIRGFKQGKYDVQLDGEARLRHVLPNDLQPLVSQLKAQRLLFPEERARRGKLGVPKRLVTHRQQSLLLSEDVPTK